MGVIELTLLSEDSKQIPYIRIYSDRFYEDRLPHLRSVLFPYDSKPVAIFQSSGKDLYDMYLSIKKCISEEQIGSFAGTGNSDYYSLDIDPLYSSPKGLETLRVLLQQVAK